MVTDGQFQQKAMQVSWCLYPWDIQPDTSPYAQPTVVELVNPQVEGARLIIKLVEAGKGRIAVWGAYPEGFRPLPEQCPRITVAAERNARSIADDITRRFLPLYLPLFEKAAEQARAFAASQARCNRAIDELADTLGVAARRYCDLNQYGEVRHYGRKLGVVIAQPYDFERDGGVTVKLEISRVPLDTALAICRLVKPAME